MEKINVNDEMIVNIPPDYRGLVVKNYVIGIGITEFTRDDYGNFEFRTTPEQFQKLLSISNITTESIDSVQMGNINYLKVGDVVYGQYWISDKEKEEWNERTNDAW